LPLGVYWLRPGLPIAKGEIVHLAIPSSHRGFVSSRGYLPADVHLLKRVVALAGDHVCLVTDGYVVNGVVISTIASVDSVGRPLTPWRFCGVVPPGLAFVATPASTSLDSRYFGPVPVTSLTVARALWIS
jgi:conjugative transfer signal peptidase TraF